MNKSCNTDMIVENPPQEWFFKLVQLCEDGLALFDRELRYVQVNEQMAEISGKSVEELVGSTVKQADPGFALAIEPVLLQVIETGNAVAGLETEVPKSTADDVTVQSYCKISCYPFMSDSETVTGIGVIVRDITEQKLKDIEQEDRLLFEALLSDLSAAFINIPVSEVDRKIEQGLHQLVDFLGFDRGTIWLYSPDDGRAYRAYSHALPGIKQPPLFLDDLVPIWKEMGKRGEIFKVSDVEALPDEFWREKKYCREMGGIKSDLFIPLNVGGRVVGQLAFVSCRVKRSWPDQLIQRLRLIWEIFGNALERKQADQKIQKALAEIGILKDRLEAENHYLRDQIDTEYKHEEIIGQSSAIRKALQLVEQVANTNSTVLLLGETGTGKELMARAIHNISSRKSRAMIKLNCAALPATLIEAELFGHEKGAYTGAMSTQTGRFEAADGSTIFLDEIGELPLELQSKLLRVLQESQFERLGSTKPIKVDVRVIAATNRDLVKEVREGRFREDLYYRLNVFPLSVPPLRERKEDIPALVRNMVQEFGTSFGKTIERIPKKNMEALERYHWPGNVRELRNVIERAMILNNGPSLVVDLPDSTITKASLEMSFEEMERMHIIAVMDSTGWRVRGKKGAAEKLRLNPATLESKMRKLGIKRKAPDA